MPLFLWCGGAGACYWRITQTRVHFFVGGSKVCLDVGTFEKDPIEIGSPDSNDIARMLTDREKKRFVSVLEGFGASLAGWELVVVPQPVMISVAVIAGIPINIPLASMALGSCLVFIGGDFLKLFRTAILK